MSTASTAGAVMAGTIRVSTTCAPRACNSLLRASGARRRWRVPVSRSTYLGARRRPLVEPHRCDLLDQSFVRRSPRHRGACHMRLSAPSRRSPPHSAARRGTRCAIGLAGHCVLSRREQPSLCSPAPLDLLLVVVQHLVELGRITRPSNEGRQGQVP